MHPQLANGVEGTAVVIIALLFRKWPKSVTFFLGLVAAILVGPPILLRAQCAAGTVDPPLCILATPLPWPGSIPTTMKAAVWDHTAVGGVRVQNEPVPPLTNGREALVKVDAAAFNPVDYKLKAPYIPFARWLLPNGMGRDFAGTIVSVGPACSLKFGDHVFGMQMAGVMQQYTKIDCEGPVAAWPKTANSSAAAGIGVAGITSFQALASAEVKSGSKVVVLGASGGCGLLGVQFAAKLGATSIVGVVSQRNAEFVRGNGATETVDYRDPDALQQWVDEHKGSFDVVYDTVSSPDPVDPNYVPQFTPVLRPNGRYVAINGSPVSWVTKFAAMATRANLQGDRYDLFIPVPTGADFATIAQWIDDGAVTMAIDSEYTGLSLENIEAAVERQKSRRARGKVVVRMQ